MTMTIVYMFYVLTANVHVYDDCVTSIIDVKSAVAAGTNTSASAVKLEAGGFK